MYPFLHRQEVQRLLTVQRYLLLNLYFTKQKARNVISRSKLSLFYGPAGLLRYFPIPASNSLVLFIINFNQLSNTPPAISNLDLVIIFSATNLLSFQKVSSCLFT